METNAIEDIMQLAAQIISLKTIVLDQYSIILCTRVDNCGWYIWTTTTQLQSSCNDCKWNPSTISIAASAIDSTTKSQDIHANNQKIGLVEDMCTIKSIILQNANDMYDNLMISFYRYICAI